MEITRGKKNKKLLITTIIDRCELLKCSGCRNVAGDFCNLFNHYPFDGNEIPKHFIWNLNINSILYPNVETGVMEKLLTDGDLKFEFYVDRQNRKAERHF